MSKYFLINDLYSRKEKINLDKGFWWEKLPIIKNLATKRALGKSGDYRCDLLLNYFNLKVERFGNKLYLIKDKKVKVKVRGK